jgi:D-glycero-D-manno-heptose 1,7-bisphosphate phosphatase
METLVSRRFVLLDRDGTINEEVGYVLRPDELRLIPGAADALRELRDLGLGLVVLTNQSPIGRGMLSVDELERIHARLSELLVVHGATLDRIEFCPHRPDEGCACRKPGTLMVERAAAALGFDPAASWLVGDHGSDLRLGRAVGARTILVRTGHGEQELERGAAEDADHVVADLLEAASVIRDDPLTSVEP